MGILKKHQQGEIRYQDEDLIIYEPTKNIKDEIKSIIGENAKLEENQDGVNVQVGIKTIRFLIKELTSIGEEVNDYSDEELENILDGADFKLNKLIRELIKILEEISEEVVDSYISQIKSAKNLIEMYETEKEMNRLNKKIEKLKPKKSKTQK